MTQKLQEGEYLAAGVKKVPIPFTQDPLLKGDKEDMNNDSFAMKGVELRSDENGDKEEAEGKKDLKLKKKEAVGFTGNGDSMAESFKEFNLGDTVCVGNIKNRKWIIESIHPDESGHNAKFNLKSESGQRKMIVRTDEMIVEHIEGVEIHRERFEDSVNDLRKVYEEMEMNGQLEEGTQPAGAEPDVAPEMMPKCESALMEKNKLYETIKSNGLHECGDHGMAIQKLAEMCGNPMEEIHSVYEHACMSHNNPKMDEMYGYSESTYNDNNAGLMQELDMAYEQMMKKEMEETAKKTDEEGDRSGSTGGLNLTSIGPAASTHI